MALITFNNIGISGISACVPKNVVKNIELNEIFSADELKNAIKTTGIAERRFADPDICSSDLCYEAAEKLIADKKINKESIDFSTSFIL